MQVVQSEHDRAPARETALDGVSAALENDQFGDGSLPVAVGGAVKAGADGAHAVELVVAGGLVAEVAGIVLDADGERERPVGLRRERVRRGLVQVGEPETVVAPLVMRHSSVAPLSPVNAQLGLVALPVAGGAF